MSKKIILVALIAVLGMIAFLVIGKQPKDYRELMKLKSPRMTTMEKQAMLVIERTGDPEKIASDAMATLFKAFFTLKKNNNDLKLVAPRARWPKPPETPRAEWVGLFGLPLSVPVESLPETFVEDFPDIRLEEWTYGEIGEILHIGPYDTEKTTIEKLRIFVNENGYVLSGIHEEEYVKGPGMFAKGNPDEYLTIIRHQIKKAGTQQTTAPAEVTQEEPDK